MYEGGDFLKRFIVCELRYVLIEFNIWLQKSNQILLRILEVLLAYSKSIYKDR